MISGMIIIGYPCIGKTSTADISNGIIDLESSYFNNGNQKWYESYVNVAQDLASQGYTVLVSSHSNVVHSLKMSGHPDISNGVIDLESSYFNNGNPKWYESYVNVAQDLASQGYTVFVSSHSNVVHSLNTSGHPDIPVVVFCPALEFKEDWIERAKIRFENSKLSKDERAYKRIEEHFEEDINALANSGFEVHYLDNNNSCLYNSIIYERYRLDVRFPNE